MNNSLETVANLDAERFVIGGLFSMGAESFARASEILTSASFTLEKHRLVFAAMGAVFDAGRDINYGTVLLELQKRDAISRVGSVIDLAEGMPSLHNVEAFCEEVAEAERLRKLWLAGRSIQERVEQGERSEEIIAETELSLSKTQTKSRQKGNRPSQIVERVGGLERFFQPDSGRAILTPWPRVNRRTNGLRPGQLWVLGGIAGTGKTSMALNIIEYAVGCGMRVKVISREMVAEELLFNLTCTRAEVDNQTVRGGKVTAEERSRLASALSDFAVLMDDFLEIEDQECSTNAAIGASLRKNVAEGRPVDLLVIDYLQLLHGVGKFDSRREEVDQIAYGCKELARTFRVPVLALAQLNTRKLETEGGAPRNSGSNKRPSPPSLGDFRESAAIEQAADLAWILRRTDVEQQFRQVQLIDAFLLKQRSGQTGKIPFKFRASVRRFEEVPEYDSGYPESQ